MADDLLDRRLRSALGPEGPAARAPDVVTGRRRVLSGLRRRRLRRLQALGAGAAVVAALAVGVPLALSQGGGPHSVRGVAAGSAARAPERAPVGTALCRIRGAVTPCGGYTGAPAEAGAPTAPAAVTSRSGQAEYGVRGSASAPLVLRAGQSVSVVLPSAPAGMRWAAPEVSPSAGGLRGAGPVTVRRTGGPPGVRLVLRAARPGLGVVSVALEPAHACAPPGCARARWSLTVEVER